MQPSSPCGKHFHKDRTFLFIGHVAIMATAIVLTCSCRRTTVIEVPEDPRQQIDERLLNANKYIASSEQTQIAGYISRRGWATQQLPCGASLHIDQQGNGRTPDYEDRVRVDYQLSTLNGVVLYPQRSETLTVGRRQATAALDEALKRLPVGSHAHLIVPSEAGYGVIGDGDRVPSRAILVYDLTVKGIEKTNK